MARYVGWDGHISQQEDDELKEFIKLAKGNKVRSYLEIGMGEGIAFHAIVSSLPKDGVYMGIDAPYDRASGPIVMGMVKRQLWLDGYAPLTVIGNSADHRVVEYAKKFAPFDLILIDGDHTPQGVLQDWENYGPLGKIIAFHDIHSGFVPSFGVAKLWNEIKGSYKYQEITGAVGAATGLGIGVLWR
jgi:predicted O-methyltransferase YrrM